MNYGISKSVNLSYDQAIEKATEELKKEGFGVLTIIDVKETMKKKLDKDVERYIILGACNPPFAYEALMAEEQIGILMPCNVIVYERNGEVKVSGFNSALISMISDNPKLTELSKVLTEKMQRVINNV
jgi:uncharacterized protein (DUF302 family)